MSKEKGDEKVEEEAKKLWIETSEEKPKLNSIQRVFAYDLEGDRFDVGEKLGYVETTLAFALKDPEIRDQITELMKSYLAKTEKNSD